MGMLIHVLLCQIDIVKELVIYVGRLFVLRIHTTKNEIDISGQLLLIGGFLFHGNVEGLSEYLP